MIYIMLGKGFEEIEAIAPGDILKRARIPVQYVGIGDICVSGAHDITVKADITVDQMNLDEMDMIVFPGGGEGVASIEADETAMAALDYAVKNDRYVAAICAAPMILGKRGLLDGKNATCYPGCESNMGKANVQGDKEVVVDGKMVTGRAPGAAIEFGLTLAGLFHGEYTPDEICQYMVYSR